MKHIKLFESFEEDIKHNSENVRYHKMMIKDVFQDVIDDYDIEYNLGELDDIDGLYYFISENPNGKEIRGDRKKHNIIYFDISYIMDTQYAISKDIMNIDLSKHIQRLENMGYGVSEHIRNDEFDIEKYGHNCNITLEIKIPDIKTFESLSDDEYYTTLVRDVFQDVIDEYGMVDDKYRDNDEDGLFYSISPISCNAVQVYIREYVEGTIRELRNHNFDFSKELNRLRSIGLNVQDDSNQNYNRLHLPHKQIIFNFKKEI